MQNNKKEDMDIEKVVCGIVKHYVWDNNEMFEKYIPTMDEESQFKGSDYILSDYEGKYKNLVVDEKAAYTYVNKYLNTFAMETSSINAIGKIEDGWFLKEGLITDAYAFVWPIEADVPKLPNKHFWDYTKISIDTIKEFEVILVLKKAIFDYLASIGLTVDEIRKITNKIRERGYVTRDEYNMKNGVCFRYGTHRNDREIPVNMLLSKPLLKDLSIYRKFLTTK